MTIVQALEYVVYSDDCGNLREIKPGHILRTEEPGEGTIVEQHPNSFAEPDWAWAAEKGEKRK
jgi:hypothetical protein